MFAIEGYANDTTGNLTKVLREEVYAEICEEPAIFPGYVAGEKRSGRQPKVIEYESS